MSQKNNEYVSQTAFAEKVNVSRQRIQAGIKKGILKESVKKIKKGKRVDVKIHLEKGLSEWASNTDETRRSVLKESSVISDNDKKKKPTLTEAKTIREIYNAKKAELDYKEKAGQLIPLKQVKGECYKIIRQARDSVLSVPERVAPEILEMKDPREISIFIKEQLAFALKDLEALENVPRK